MQTGHYASHDLKASAKVSTREMWNTNLIYKSDGWYWLDEEGGKHGPYAGRGAYQKCANDALEYDAEMVRTRGGLQREF